jgi:hypothetical protein
MPKRIFQYLILFCLYISITVGYWIWKSKHSQATTRQKVSGSLWFMFILICIMVMAEKVLQLKSFWHLSPPSNLLESSTFPCLLTAGHAAKSRITLEYQISILYTGNHTFSSGEKAWSWFLISMMSLTDLPSICLLLISCSASLKILPKRS